MADSFIRHLARRGHTVHVLAGLVQLAEPYPANVVLHRMKIHNQPYLLLSRVSWVIQARMIFRRLSKQTKIDIVHQLNPVVSGLSLAVLGTSVPLVMGPYVPQWAPTSKKHPSLRSQVRSWSGPYLRNLLWGLQHRQTNAILLSSPAALEVVAKPASVQRKLYIIPYGIDVEKFPFKPLPQRRSVLFLGRLHRSKGIFVLVRAFAAVADQAPDCTLVIAGTGAEKANLQTLIAELHLEDRVEFIGQIERAAIASVIGASTVVCMPSFGEPFGLVALEAMACGRPVVTTDAGGLAHLVPDEGGARVPVDDSVALAEALTKLILDASLCESAGKVNRHLVETTYAWPKIIERLEEAYSATMQLSKKSVSGS